MMKKQKIIDEIYTEGDKDVLFFGFLAGYIESAPIDGCTTEIDVFKQTLDLCRYLVESGDFCAGRMSKINDQVQFIVYKNGFSDFEKDAQSLMNRKGLSCDALTWELALTKVKMGARPGSLNKI